MFTTKWESSGPPGRHVRSNSSVDLTRLGAIIAAALLAALTLASGIAAQERGELAGAIVGEDGTPVAGAEIRISGTGIQGLTASNGRFLIRRVPPGTHQVEIYALGYEDATAEVTVPAAGVGTLDVQLVLRPVEVQGLQVHVLRPDLRHTAQLEADAVRESNPRDVGDALRGISGVDAVRRGPIGLDPSVRALRETEVGTYMNGTRLFPAGPARMDSPLTHLDPSAVQHIEVVKGPYALTWGAGNMAAIRIDTRTVPPQIPGALHGTLTTGYDGNLGAQEYSSSLFGSNDRFAYWGHGVYRTGNDYEAGNGEVIPADFESWEIRGQGGLRTGEASWLSLTTGYQEQGPIDYPGRLLSAKSFETVNLSAEWELSRDAGLLRSANLQAYVNDVEHQMDNIGKPTRMDMEGRVPPFALDVLVDSRIDVTGGRASMELVPDGGDLNLQVGSDVYSANRDARRFIDALDPGQMTPPLFPYEDQMWPDATITDLGVWARADHPISDLWSFSGAVRLDFVSADGDAADFVTPDRNGLTFFDKTGTTPAAMEQTETNWSASGTLSANLSSTWNLSIGAGTVVRTADATERYSNQIPGSKAQISTEFVGDPELDPERSTQGDVWVEGRYPTWSLDANVFVRRISDYITLAPRTDLDFVLPLTASLGNSTVYQYVNGAADFWGFETSVGYRWTDRLSSTVGLEYMEGRDTKLDEPAFGVAPPSADLNVRYELADAGHFVEGTLIAVGRQDRLATTRGETSETPGYATLDLQAGFTPYQGLQLRAGINNVLDKAYYNHLNAKNPFSRQPVPEPGRVLFIKATYSF